LGKSSVTGTENRDSDCKEEEAFDPDAGLRVCKGNCSDCMGCILHSWLAAVSNAEAIINSINVSQLRLLYHALWCPANVLFQN